MIHNHWSNQVSWEISELQRNEDFPILLSTSRTDVSLATLSFYSGCLLVFLDIACMAQMPQSSKEKSLFFAEREAWVT